MYATTKSAAKNAEKRSDSTAASHGRCEAPRRVVRGRRGLAGEAARPSRRRAIVGERGAPKGRARPQGGRGPGERSETRDGCAGSDRVRERDLEVLSRITRAGAQSVFKKMLQRGGVPDSIEELLKGSTAPQ